MGVHKSCGGLWELVWLIGVIVLIPIRFESAIFHSDPVALQGRVNCAIL